MKTTTNSSESPKTNDPSNVGRHSVAELMPHTELMTDVLKGRLKLCNSDDATYVTSWKAGGQDFTIYATEARELLGSEEWNKDEETIIAGMERILLNISRKGCLVGYPPSVSSSRIYLKGACATFLLLSDS